MTDSPRPRRRLRRIAFWVVGLLVAMVGGSLFVPPPALPALPDPNGYDDLIAAGKLVTGDWNLPRFEAAPVETIRPLVEGNTKALERIRLGLGRESRFTLDYSPETLNRGIEGVGPLRACGRVLLANARLAALEGRTSEAKAFALDTIRAGRAGSNGGLAVQALAGIAMESQGLALLAKLQDTLSTEECRGLIEDLVRLDASRESMRSVFDRDLDYAFRSKSAGMRLSMNIAWPMLKAQQQAAFRSASNSEQQVSRDLRMLALRLAARAFFLDKGKHPASLEELLKPEWRTLGHDPANDQPFQMEAQPDGSPRFFRSVPDAS